MAPACRRVPETVQAVARRLLAAPRLYQAWQAGRLLPVLPLPAALALALAEPPVLEAQRARELQQVPAGAARARRGVLLA